MNLDRNVFLSHTRVVVVKIIVYALLALGFFIFIKPNYWELSIFLFVMFILGEVLFITTNYWEYLQTSFLTKLKRNLTEIFIFLGAILWGLIYKNIPLQITDLSIKIIENFLALLIGILALGVPFFLDISRKASTILKDDIVKASTYGKNDVFFGTFLITSIIASFVLLFVLKNTVVFSSEKILPFTNFDYFLIAEIIVFILVFSSFLIKRFKDGLALENNIIKNYGGYLKGELKRCVFRAPYINPVPSFIRENKKKGVLRKFGENIAKIINYLHQKTYFIDGKIKLYLITDKNKTAIDKNAFDGRIAPKVKALYRIVDRKIKNEEFEQVDLVLSVLLDFTNSYVSLSGYTVSGFDNYFTSLVIPETKSLFERALETNHQDGLEKIVHFVGKTSLILLQNVSDEEIQYNQAIPTSGLEDLLSSFCTKAFMKEDSPATSIAIDYLKQITLFYAQKGEFIKASLSFRNLNNLAAFFAELPKTLIPLKLTKPHMIQWAQSKCLQAVKSSIDILSLNLEVGTACKDHFWRQFAEEVLRGFQENLVKLHKASLEAETQVGWEYYVPIFDEIRSIILRIEDRERFNDEQRESLYFLFPDLFWRLVNISAEANALKNDRDRNDNAPKKDHVQTIMFLFGSMVNIYRTTENDRLKAEIEHVLSKYSTLFDKNISFLERTFHPVNCIDEFSVIIATSIIYYDEANCFQELLKKSIQNIIEYFETYNDENDQFKHKRRHIYKRLLIYGVWLRKHLVRKGGVYNKVRRFLIQNEEFLERTSLGSTPFPECDHSDSFGRIDKIWRLKDKDFYITRFDESFAQKATDFDNSIENTHWDFLRTIRSS